MNSYSGVLLSIMLSISSHLGNLLKGNGNFCGHLRFCNLFIPTAIDDAFLASIKILDGTLNKKKKKCCNKNPVSRGYVGLELVVICVLNLHRIFGSTFL